MNDSRTKLGLMAAFLFALGSALFWNGLYRGAGEDVRERELSPAVMRIVHGGDLPSADARGAPAARQPAPAGAVTGRTARANPAPRPEERTFEVRKGDSLYEIAEDACGDPALWTEIARLNRIPEPYRIHPGQVLRLPVASR